MHFSDHTYHAGTDRVVTHDTSTAVSAAETRTQPDDRPLIPVMKPWLGDEEAEAAAEAVRSGWVAQGPRVAEFEAAFAAHLGAGHAVAASSCTTALHLAMVLAGLGPGDEVVVPSLSFIATANAPRYVQATPVFADVEQATQNLTAETVEAVLTPATERSSWCTRGVRRRTSTPSHGCAGHARSK